MELKNTEEALQIVTMLRKPDWQKWARRTHCKVWQVVALALNIEPDETAGRIRDLNINDFSNRLRDARTALSNSGNAKCLPYQIEIDSMPKSKHNWMVDPRNFIGYADSMGWNLPDEFRKAFSGASEKSAEIAAKVEMSVNSRHTSPESPAPSVLARNAKAAETRKMRTEQKLLLAALHRAAFVRGEIQKESALTFLNEGLEALGLNVHSETIAQRVQDAFQTYIENGGVKK